MAITATYEGGGSFEPVPAGNYIGRCYSMVHIGTVQETYQGETKLANKVRITWELPTELKVFNEEKGEQPHSIGKEFTLSMHEKATLRKFLESWRGKAFTDDEARRFDITVLLGKPCMLNVIHKTSQTTGKVYAEIASVSPMPKGITAPDQINKSFEFNYEPFDQDVFDQLPEWLRTKCSASLEYMKAQQPHHTEVRGAESDDDLPF